MTNLALIAISGLVGSGLAVLMYYLISKKIQNKKYEYLERCKCLIIKKPDKNETLTLVDKPIKNLKPGDKTLFIYKEEYWVIARTYALWFHLKESDNTWVCWKVQNEELKRIHDCLCERVETIDLTKFKATKKQVSELSTGEWTRFIDDKGVTYNIALEKVIDEMYIYCKEATNVKVIRGYEFLPLPEEIKPEEFELTDYYMPGDLFSGQCNYQKKTGYYIGMKEVGEVCNYYYWEKE